MSMTKIWIHAVWGTKNRAELLTKSVRQNIFIHMRANAKEKGIHIDFINGYTDHVHLLISLNADQCISKVIQLIKGESAFWINKNNLVNEKFEWQGEYFAASVSHLAIDKVRDYIKNQEAHHSEKSFKQEYNEFAAKHGFSLE